MTAPHLMSPAAHGDLDARIAAVEQRLIDREARLRHGWTAFGDHVKDAARPSRLLAPALGLATAALTLRQLLRGSHHAHPHAQHASAFHGPPRPDGFLANLPWGELLAIGWPMLPRDWRDRLPEPVPQLVMTLGPRVLQRLFSRPPG